MVTLIPMSTSASLPTARASGGHSDWVDHAKAIGVVLVVYGHVARGVFNAGVAFPPDLFRLSDSVLYTFHMPLFFFLSGLFFQPSLRRHGPAGMIGSKIGTLLWPYLVWSLLQGAIEVLLSSHTNHPITWHEVLALWDPRAQFWFLMALFIVFVGATLLQAVLPGQATGVLLVAGALAHVLAPASTHESLPAHLADNTVFFALGIVFAGPRGEAVGRVARLGSLPVIAAFTAAFALSQQVFHVRLGLHWTDNGVATLALGVTSILAVVALAVGVSRWGGGGGRPGDDGDLPDAHPGRRRHAHRAQAAARARVGAALPGRRHAGRRGGADHRQGDHRPARRAGTVRGAGAARAASRGAAGLGGVAWGILAGVLR